MFQMTWIRLRDYHILTSGALTQTMDGRFGVVRGETVDWALRIRFVQLRDQGLYECQVRGQIYIRVVRKKHVYKKRIFIYTNSVGIMHD